MDILVILVLAPIVAFSQDASAKGLALLDAYLAHFATVTPAEQMNICGTTWTFYNATLTPCGESYVRDYILLLLMQWTYGAEDMEGMVHSLLGLLAI